MRSVDNITRMFAAVSLAVTWLVVSIMPAQAEPDIDDSGDGVFVGTHNWGDEKPKKDRRHSTTPQQRGRSPRSTPRSRPINSPPPTSCERGPDGQFVDPDVCADVFTSLHQDTAEELARRLVVRLQLPDPTPQFGPDPADNEWNMLAVGYPIWLWTEGPRTVTATETAYGYTFTLRARYRTTSFEMGDGHTKRCTTTTAYQRSVRPGAKSPTCSYTFLEAAPEGTYTVTATTHWDIDWSVSGHSGTLQGTHSASRELPVGELQAIVVG